MTVIDRQKYREQRDAAVKLMGDLIDKAERAGGKMSAEDSAEFDRLEANAKHLGRLAGITTGERDNLDTRGMAAPAGRAGAGVEGRANEAVRPGQVREWFDKAVRNNVGITTGSRESGYRPVSLASQGTDRDLNRYW